MAKETEQPEKPAPTAREKLVKIRLRQPAFLLGLNLRYEPDEFDVGTKRWKNPPREIPESHAKQLGPDCEILP